MTEPNGYRIEAVDPAIAPDADVREAALLQQLLVHERIAEDPLSPVEVFMDRFRAKVTSEWHAVFIARDAHGRIAGRAFVGRELDDPENAHIRWCEVGVHPAHRRRGVGRALLGRIVDACVDQGQDLVFMGQTTDRIPAGEAFARAIGGAPGLDMRSNQLDLAAVDRAKVTEWATIDPKGYRLARIDAAVPAELMAPYIEAVGGMNDAPRGALRMGNWRVTEAQVHDRESWFRQAGIEWWLLLAIHDASGAGAGFTEVSHDPRVAHLVHQQGTAVIEAHRGHRLGLWMKAAMLRRILAERPAARYVRTGNANTNAQMLAINTQLGFVHAWSTVLWQLAIADARRTLPLARMAETAQAG